jgi:hypothetical protein
LLAQGVRLLCRSYFFVIRIHATMVADWYQLITQLYGADQEAWLSSVVVSLGKQVEAGEIEQLVCALFWASVHHAMTGRGRSASGARHAAYLIEQVRANGIDRGIPPAAEAAGAGSLKTQENPQASGAVPIQAVR